MNERSTFAEVWKCDWTTDVETEVVLIVTRAIESLGVTAKGVGVEYLVADKVIDLAVIFVSTTLLREVNDAAR